MSYAQQHVDPRDPVTYWGITLRQLTRVGEGETPYRIETDDGKVIRMKPGPSAGVSNLEKAVEYEDVVVAGNKTFAIVEPRPVRRRHLRAVE